MHEPSPPCFPSRPRNSVKDWEEQKKAGRRTGFSEKEIMKKWVIFFFL
jgi:hypothetical protein